MGLAAITKRATLEAEMKYAMEEVRQIVNQPLASRVKSVLTLDKI